MASDLDTQLRLNRHQTKFMTANVAGSVSGNGAAITELTFNGLVTGRLYRISGYVRILQTTNNAGATLNIVHNGTVIHTPNMVLNMSEFSAGEEFVVSSGINHIFTAAAATLTFFSFGSGSTVLGSGTEAYRTVIILEELHDTSVTTSFT